MKKGLRQALSLVLAAAMLITMTGITAFAEGTITLPEITGFSIPDQVASSVYAQSRSIHVVMPAESNLNGLTPEVVHTGESYSPQGPQDFTNSITYSVTSQAGTQDYIVSVLKSNELVDVYAGSQASGEKIGSYSSLEDAISAVSQLDGTEYTIQAKTNFGSEQAPITLPTLPGKSITFAGTGSSNDNGRDTRNTLYFSGDLSGAVKLSFDNIKVELNSSSLQTGEVHLTQASLSNVILPQSVTALNLSNNSSLLLSNQALSYTATLTADATENVLTFFKPEGQASAKLQITGAISIPEGTKIKVQIDGVPAANDVLLTSGETANDSLTARQFQFAGTDLYLVKTGNDIVLVATDHLITSVTAELAAPLRGTKVSDSGDAAVSLTANYEHTHTDWKGAAEESWQTGEIPVATVILTAKEGYSFADITADQIHVEGATVTIESGQGAQDDVLTFTVTFPMINGYKITIDPTIENGTVTSNVDFAISRTTVYLTLTPNEGYRVVPGSVEYTYRNTTEQIIGTSFEMPNRDVVVTAEFEEIPEDVYDILIEDNIENGTIVTVPHVARRGETVYVTAIPEEGYRLADDSLTYNGSSINNFTFNMPDEEVTVGGYFEEWDGTYTLKIRANTGGQITTGSNGQYAPGEEIELQATPYSNYTFTGWSSSDGGSFTSESAIKTVFTMPDNDTTVTANFQSSGSSSGGGGGGGGSTSSVRYIILATAGEGGSISPSGSVYVARNGNQAFTITPNSGYRVADVLVNGESVGAVTSYEMTNVQASGNIRVVFEEGTQVDPPVDPSNKFTDIENHWAKDDILSVVESGLFSGMSETEFAPDLSITRGMFVTVLGRLDQADVSGKTSTFSDVPATEYYAPYVAWAAENNIVSGMGNNEFAPNSQITREQMALIISNYLNYAGVTLEEVNAAIDFTDQEMIADWAQSAVSSMQKAGLINGRDDQTFDPKGTATRAEAAAIMRRLQTSIQ